MPPAAYSSRRRPKTSPTAETSAFPPFPPSSSTLPDSYHSQRTNPDAGQSGKDHRVVEPKRSTTEDTMHAIATMGRAHKSNFSVTSLLGAQPDTKFGPKPRQLDPKSPGNLEDNRARFPSQGPYRYPLAGSSGASAFEPWKALEPPGPSGESRNLQSTISLKLKIPNFKNFGKSRSRSDEGQQAASLTSRPQTPSMWSPLLGTRPLFPNDTLPLGAMQFEHSNPNNSYLIPSRAPKSEEGSDSWNSRPFSPTSTLGSQEESLPQTPCTIRSGFFQPGSPALSGIAPSHREEDDLKYNTFLRDNVPSSLSDVVHNAELLKTRTRSIPTITQDDMSINTQNLTEKSKSLNRMSRRASLSTTSMLSSSTTPSQIPNSTSHSDGSDSQAVHALQSATTPTSHGYQGGGQGASPITPLSPITFESIASSELDPTRIPVADLVAPETPSKDYDDTASTPTAVSHHDMPFNSFAESDPTPRSSRSSSQSRSASRNHSSGMKTPRGPTPEPPTHTNAHTRAARTKISPAQAAKWEQERLVITEQVLEEHSGEACIIRFESKQGWMGFWNRSDIDNVIDELRDLRLPKV